MVVVGFWCFLGLRVLRIWWVGFCDWFWLLWLCRRCGRWMGLVAVLDWCLLLWVGGVCLDGGLALVSFAGFLLI